MDNVDNIYTVFNSVNEGSIWTSILTTLIGAFFGAWIVYIFNIRFENRKKREDKAVAFENLKITIDKTIEEYRMIAQFISEYRSKGDFCIKLKDYGHYFNENLYNVRAAKFDDFRLKFAEIRGMLLTEINQLIEQSSENLDLKTDLETVKKYTPGYISYDEFVINKPDGKILTEPDVDLLIKKMLVKETEVYGIVKKLQSSIKSCILRG